MRLHRTISFDDGSYAASFPKSALALEVGGDVARCPLQPLELRSRRGGLTARLAQHSPDETVVLIEEVTAASPAAAPHATLTAREAEILHWLGEGKRNNEIGTILGISARTVGKHLEHIFVKLGVETRTAAARVAANYRRPDGA